MLHVPAVIVGSEKVFYYPKLSKILNVKHLSLEIAKLTIGEDLHFEQYM